MDILELFYRYYNCHQRGKANCMMTEDSCDINLSISSSSESMASTIPRTGLKRMVLTLLLTIIYMLLLVSQYSCPTLWDPMDCSTWGLPVPPYLPEFAQVHIHWVSDAIQPYHPSHLCACMHTHTHTQIVTCSNHIHKLATKTVPKETLQTHALICRTKDMAPYVSMKRV